MNIMVLESIEYEVAKKAAEGTKYDWTNLCDGQAMSDLKRDLMRRTHLTEEEAREAFEKFFKDEIIALDWEG